MRVGFGYDAHAFSAGHPLIIGGVTIPFDRGPVGHSDADVLIHAIIDALLGAAGMRDIGHHFPGNDMRYRDIDSGLLLATVTGKLRETGYSIGNVDATVCLQRPGIAHYIPEMQRHLSGLMGVATDCVSVKATTTEGLGFTGREEGISAYAVALIRQSAP